MLKHNDSGNALFLILIAVALFAALSYAVTQSGRGGGGIDRETTALSASQLVQYGALANSVITRMRIATGCAENEFSFERSPFDGTDAAYVNPIANARGDFSCHFYHPNGGNMVEFDPNSAAGLTEATSEVEFYGHVRISGVATEGSGPTDEGTDLAVYVRNIDPTACGVINNGVGLNEIVTDFGDINVEPFTGDYAVSDGLDGCFDTTGGGTCGGDPSMSPIGSRNIQNGCFIESMGGDHVYFHVLLPR